MKKWIIYFFLAIILLAISLNWISVKKSKPIPLLEDVYFGMSPKAVEKQLGGSSEISRDITSSDKTIYIYNAVIQGQDATITCFFQNDRKLTEVHLRWNSNSPELFDWVYSCLFECFSDKKDFFVKSSDEPGRIDIGLDNGVTGLFFSVYSDKNCINVICVDNS